MRLLSAATISSVGGGGENIFYSDSRVSKGACGIWAGEPSDWCVISRSESTPRAPRGITRLRHGLRQKQLDQAVVRHSYPHLTHPGTLSNWCVHGTVHRIHCQCANDSLKFALKTERGFTPAAWADIQEDFLRLLHAEVCFCTKKTTTQHPANETSFLAQVWGEASILTHTSTLI